ncbi:hypothetical protein HLH44_13930 [Gluconacetobacter sp. 1c LMG 22058]|uniref:GNAT family N-acetyltransferase n=1 Tax=Gluconacetobacter dulcium TaxID=2729096 RepID=A0A7W4K1H4_9PROT|nr:hypothetical protein [Gluconacetobacter dulcium]
MTWTGWLPQHAAIRDPAGRLLAAAPMYAKPHSCGEYVFDQSWARAFEQAGGDYYPKLQVAVPFSPVPGPRLLVRDDAADRPGLRRVEAGAQGQHKIQRGYRPTPTYSAHWIAHSGLRRAVAEFMTHEREAMLHDMAELDVQSPYRAAGED